MTTQPSRDTYLATAAEHILKILLLPAGYKHPETHGAGFRVTCGLSQRSRSVRGQCFPVAASADNVNEVFISPALDDTQEVLAELTYQMARACQNGRYPASPDLFVRLPGSAGKPATIQATDKLAEVLTLVEQALGAYPHAALRKPKASKPRQRKHTCYTCDAVWRSSMKWARLMTACPCCQSDDIGIDVDV